MLVKTQQSTNQIKQNSKPLAAVLFVK
ncbi:bifunctional GMP synthase/glutamine amidotransferase protein [Marinobacter sp. ELB17]|nr:bifunctional GMP synthase/glutamine amidotransferase protein [Marinobacter sp. ELB17]